MAMLQAFNIAILFQYLPTIDIPRIKCMCETVNVFPFPLFFVERQGPVVGLEQRLTC